MDLWDRNYEKNKRGVCAVRYCRKRREKHRRICRRCRERLYVINNPVTVAYRRLKNHAKERGISFSLTFLEFEEFCLMTGYLDMKGREKMSFSVDRVNNQYGYSADNIQVMTLSDNSRKAHVDRRLAREAADEPALEPHELPY